MSWNHFNQFLKFRKFSKKLSCITRTGRLTRPLRVNKAQIALCPSQSLLIVVSFVFLLRPISKSQYLRDAAGTKYTKILRNDNPTFGMIKAQIKNIGFLLTFMWQTSVENFRSSSDPVCCTVVDGLKRWFWFNALLVRLASLKHLLDVKNHCGWSVKKDAHQFSKNPKNRVSINSCTSHLYTKDIT